MKKLIASCVLFLGGCCWSQTGITVMEKPVHHFANGQVGYRKDAAHWYWLVSSPVEADTPTLVGGWLVGPSPTSQALSEAVVEPRGVVMTPCGEPVTVNGMEAVKRTLPDIAEMIPVE